MAQTLHYTSCHLHVDELEAPVRELSSTAAADYPRPLLSPDSTTAADWCSRFPLTDAEAAAFASRGFLRIPRAISRALLRDCRREMKRAAPVWETHVKRPDDWRMHFLAHFPSGDDEDEKKDDTTPKEPDETATPDPKSEDTEKKDSQ